MAAKIPIHGLFLQHIDAQIIQKNDINKQEEEPEIFWWWFEA